MDRVDSYSDLVDEHGNMTFGFPREDRNIPPGSPGFHSDLEYPEWQTDVPGEPPLVDSEGHMTFGAQNRGHPGLRTNSGLLDIMHHVIEEFEYPHEDRDLEEERRARALELPPRRVWTITDVNPSLAYHTETFVIPAASGPVTAAGSATLVSARVDRARVVLTNTGTNPAFFAFTDDISNINTAGEMAWASLLSAQPVSSTNPVPSQPAVPASTTIVQNTNPYPVTVVITGGTMTNVSVNGQTVGTGAGTYIVPAAGTISLTYTVAPTWVWSNANGLTTVSLLPVPPRVLRCGGKIYVWSPLGTTVDIQEEYGYRNREGGMLSP